MRSHPLIFVLGMGRSGTSAITRVLSLCGAMLPERLVGAAPSNPTGHWESTDALRINDEFLIAHRSLWWDPGFRIQTEFSTPNADTEELVERIAEFLGGCPKTMPLVIKDPRINALIPWWLEACRRTGFDARAIVALRHPDEVVASVVARDSVSADLARQLWLKYTLLAERETRGVARVFVRYAHLLADWRLQVLRISAALNIDLNLDRAAEVEGFLHRDLRHHRVAENRNPLGDPVLSRAWRLLNSVSSDNGRVDTQALDKLLSDLMSSKSRLAGPLAEFGRLFPFPESV